ncbi:MAG: rhodanese-like domain-containing protein [Firmicutes bacterium]|nr:rhodanese-like domain-containing protein [Bacillota bacterium]
MKYVPIVLSLLLLAGCAAAPEGPSYRQISMDDAIKLMTEAEDYVILDVRRADEFAAGHIPGAIHVANESIGSGAIPELPNMDQLIMVYCRSGNRSKQASKKLAGMGYTNIVEFGGIIDWPGETET